MMAKCLQILLHWRYQSGLGYRMKKSSGQLGQLRLRNFTLFRRDWDGPNMIWQSPTFSPGSIAKMNITSIAPFIPSWPP